MNLKRMLEDAADKYADKTVIVSGDRRVSYAELDSLSSRLAEGLARTGITAGDHVAIMAANSPEFIVSCFAVIKAGAVIVPLDPKYKTAELDALFGDFQPRALIADSVTLESLSASLQRYPSIEFVIDIESESSDRYLTLGQLMEGCSGWRTDWWPEPEATAIIFYTSGPTFSPLGVMLSNRALVEESRIMGDGFGQTEKDVLMLFALPLYHVFGLVAVVFNAIRHGSSLVIVPGTGLSIGTFMAAIEAEKGTMFLGIPYIFSLAVDMAEKQGINSDLSSLRICISSGDVLPVDVISRFRELYGHTIHDGLAMTEAVCHVTFVSPDDGPELGSVGRVLPGWQLKTVDDDGREVVAPLSGEIIVKGPIMTAYLNNPSATSRFIRDGWFHTGDMGRLEENGVLYYTGRKKNIIILKGQNIVPDDIEHILSKHPAVAAAAVIGIPDKMRGEIIAAAIELRDGAEAAEHDIRKFCVEFMTDYKVPKRIIILDSLPMNPSGAVDKTALRRQLSIPPLFADAQTVQ